MTYYLLLFPAVFPRLCKKMYFLHLQAGILISILDFATKVLSPFLFPTSYLTPVNPTGKNLVSGPGVCSDCFAANIRVETRKNDFESFIG